MNFLTPFLHKNILFSPHSFSKNIFYTKNLFNIFIRRKNAIINLHEIRPKSLKQVSSLTRYLLEGDIFNVFILMIHTQSFQRLSAWLCMYFSSLGYHYLLHSKDFLFIYCLFLVFFKTINSLCLHQLII